MVKIKKWFCKHREKFIMSVSGVFVGAINGLFGGGGGMIAVPILSFALKKPTKISHATAILIILPITIVSMVIYLVKGYFEPIETVVVGAGVVVGGLLGALLLGKLKSKAIGLIFSALMLIGGIRAIFW
jgi:uncharacterized membrane protein YfcA